MPLRGHEQLDHPADLRLRIWAPSEPELLVEAARALVELLTEGQVAEPAVSRELRLDAIDAEDRLVCWLNELLLLALLDGFLVADAEVRLRADGLDATLRGQADAGALVRTELKSVTHHGVELVERNGRVEAQVLIDV